MTQDPTSTAEEPLDEHARAAADALMAQRPQPRANFRGALARRLSALDPGFGPRPPDLWWRVLVLVAIGSLLLVLGVVRQRGRVGGTVGPEGRLSRRHDRAGTGLLVGDRANRTACIGI